MLSLLVPAVLESMTAVDPFICGATKLVPLLGHVYYATMGAPLTLAGRPPPAA